MTSFLLHENILCIPHSLNYTYHGLLNYILRSALEQKKAEEDKLNQAIDYDAPIESEQNTVGLGTKVKGIFSMFFIFLIEKSSVYKLQASYTI